MKFSMNETIYKPQRTLVLRYYDYEDIYKVKAKELIKLLVENNINFVAYDNRDYYLLKVQRPQGKTWDDVMRLINSVHAAKYSYEKTIIIDGTEYFDSRINNINA